MALHLPQGYDREALLEPLTEVVRHRGDWVARWKVDGQFRRDITVHSPARFALIYLPHQLRSRETGMRYSLARLHLDLAKRARRWARPGGFRDAVVAPRFSAKSTWDLVINPMWALAHRHRRLVLGVGDSVEQIRPHLGTWRAELADNALLRQDFPHLIPARRPGVQDTASTVTTRDGCTFAVRSLGSRTRGLKIGSDRPDVIVIDDPEPDGADYSDRARARRLEIIRNTLLPMNEQAAVVLQGTVVRYGAIMHDVVLAAGSCANTSPKGSPAASENSRLPAAPSTVADWVTEEGFACHHYPAIVTGPDGVEHSFWEQRYALAWLLGQRHLHSYALNFDGRPPAPGGRHFRADSFAYGRRPVRELVMFIDTAPTVTDASDYTAYVVGGLADDGRVQLEYARAWRLTSTQIRERAQALCATDDRIRTVYLERNVAHDWARGVLEPIDLRTREPVRLAPGVRVETYLAGGSKNGRIAVLLDDVERGDVRLGDRDCARELVAQAQRWPDVDHDDLVDAGAALVDHLLRGSESGPTRAGARTSSR